MTNELPIVPPGTVLPSAPADILDGITFDDQPSVVPEQKVAPVAPAPEKVEVTPEVKPEVKAETPAPAAKPESSLPSRFDGESDTQYDLRTRLFLAGQAKANAQTDDEKSLLAQEMKKIRGEIAQVNQSQQTPPQTATPATQPIAEDERAIAIKTVKDLGFKTAEEMAADVERIVNERLQAKELQARQSDHTSAISDFYKYREDISTDTDKRANLENFVIEMFKEKLPTMTKPQLSQALDMAANYLYPRGAVSKQADAVQSKIDALNIHGSQGGDVSASTVTDSSKQKLREAGWSDADIAMFDKK